MPQGLLRILISVGCIALAGCASTSKAGAQPAEVERAFAAEGLSLTKSPVPSVSGAIDYVHYPVGGNLNDLVVTVFDEENRAISYEEAASRGLPPELEVRAVERVRNVVLLINDSAEAPVEQAAREALRSLE